MKIKLKSLRNVPPNFAIRLSVQVLTVVLHRGGNDPFVRGDKGNRHCSGGIRLWSGEFHQHNTGLLTLEVEKVPLGGSVVWLHPLHSHNKHRLTVNLESLSSGRTLLGGFDLTSDGVSWPEHVSHGAPWLLDVVTVDGGTVLTDLSSWGNLGDGQINFGFRVHLGDNVESGPILTQFDGEVLGVDVGALDDEVL
ncbi:hypothetical protein WICPIJ_003569 [Wickerhamomyces pijperi]|uniref:Uncharacterized protein n=1 Tax=Wickerhamomyces pijperi TaxID=599730 RepID=A0A9P8Q9P3_WICPI|nr:hypothetical protein WICPIJ_003569 [Wickerhamomyces pijperi]